MELGIETVVSFGLLQLPSIFLAFFGIFEAFHTHGFSFQFVKYGLHAAMLGSIPFFLLELISWFPFTYSGKSTFMNEFKFMQWADFLNFVPSKRASAKDKQLCLEFN